tara:strand:- start:35086 stop:35316 length:231 start_codon:yes stop_codon:yes gene_type:complete
MSDLDRLNNAKVTEEYDDYSEMSTDTLIKLEQEMSDWYYKMYAQFIYDSEHYERGQAFSLTDYAEIIRELTIRENK